MKKTLYFEGAGCVPCNDVENCRIRTAFTNKDGKKVYIEFTSGGGMWQGALFCHHCHYITEDPEIDDCSYSRLSCEKSNSIYKVEYTKKNILEFVNKNCNADFDEIVILDNLAGYRVFSDKKQIGWGTSEKYNFGDVFEYDEELTKRRIAKVEEMKKEFCALFGQRYDNTSYFIRDGQLVVRLNVEEKKRIEAGYKEREFVVEV